MDLFYNSPNHRVCTTPNRSAIQTDNADYQKSFGTKKNNKLELYNIFDFNLLTYHSLLIVLP